jgi:hypothetical protein
MLLMRSKSGGGSGVGGGVEVIVLLATGMIGRSFLMEVDCFALVLVVMVIVVVACVVLATKGDMSVLVVMGCISPVGSGAWSGVV